MAGLSGALNIAKNALLAFQTATQVISHNISNVNNESYCRQKVVNTTYPPSPSPVGPIGTGVRIESIKRYFDAFLERNINLKLTDYGMFKAEETGMNILESLFNETQDSGLSNILREFWTAWQNLADSPENIAARSQVIETGKLITEALKSKFEGLKDLQDQIGLKLKTIIGEINNLASQIAKLNLQITAYEAGGKSANDLRDQRDKLVAELSKLAKIQYFETKEGAYNVILGKGLNLVNLDHSWKLEISGTDVYWVGTNGEKVPVTSKEVPSGELGGWLKLLEQLSDDYNYEYVSGNKVVTNKGGGLISDSDKLVRDLGLSVGDVFKFTGRDHFGNEISGTFTVEADSTVKDLLTAIESAYNFTVKAYIKDGRLFIEDGFRGPGKLEFSFTQTPTTIDFGSFDDPAYQRRVTELNLAGKLKLFGEELVKAINELHNQGVGLTFFTKELEGAYSANRYIKELPYYLDLKRDGFFYIWVKDPTEKITPVKVQLNLDANATLNDLVTQINQALNEAGFDTSAGNYQIRALNRNGHLVFQAADGYGFAFSNDASGILLSTGINLFFLGTDPADLKINPVLINKPELISSGKMDVESYRSEKPFFGVFSSENAVDETQTFSGIDKIYVKFYDEKGHLYSCPPYEFHKYSYSEGEIKRGESLTVTIKDAQGNQIKSITITPTGLERSVPLSEIPRILEEAGMDGVIVNVNGTEKTISFELDPNYYPTGTARLEITWSDPSKFPEITQWKWDEDVKAYALSYDSANETLGDLIEKLDELPFLRAYVDTDGSLIMRLEPDQTEVYGFELGEHFTGTDATDPSQSFLSFLRDQGMIIPSFRWDGSNETRFLSGLEPLVKPTVYIGDSSITPNSSVNYKIKFFDAEGNHLGSYDQIVNGASDLTTLINNFNNTTGIKATIEGDKFYIWLDTSESGAPQNAAYFVIEAQDDGSWGLIKTNSGGAGLKAGEIDAYLFDENGDPIDAFDNKDGVTDPFRIELDTDKNLFQIFDTINAPDNRQYGLTARLDREGKLIVETTGLYDTKTFILQNQKIQLPGDTKIFSNVIDLDTDTCYYISNLSVNSSATFSSQNLTVTLYKPDGTSQTTSISVNTGDSLQDILNQLNNIDLDGDGTNDLLASIDDSGKLIIKIGDPDFNKFKIETDLSATEQGNFISYLYTHLQTQQDTSHGIINTLSGYALDRGDNRIAQAIADVSTETREALNQSNLENYYSSMVGEVGVATKSVKDSKSFLEDLLRQLKAIKDSVSGVSLDEEMTNLIKYQQAFVATSKILSTVEEMFEALINAKR